MKFTSSVKTVIVLAALVVILVLLTVPVSDAAFFMLPGIFLLAAVLRIAHRVPGIYRTRLSTGRSPRSPPLL